MPAQRLACKAIARLDRAAMQQTFLVQRYAEMQVGRQTQCPQRSVGAQSHRHL